MNIKGNLVCRIFPYIKKLRNTVVQEFFSPKFCTHPLFPPVYDTHPHFINLTVLGDYCEARRCVIYWTAVLLLVHIFFSV